MRDEILRQEYDDEHIDYTGDGQWEVIDAAKGAQGGESQYGKTQNSRVGKAKQGYGNKRR